MIKVAPMALSSLSWTRSTSSEAAMPRRSHSSSLDATSVKGSHKRWRPWGRKHVEDERRPGDSPRCPRCSGLTRQAIPWDHGSARLTNSDDESDRRCRSNMPLSPNESLSETEASGMDASTAMTPTSWSLRSRSRTRSNRCRCRRSSFTLSRKGVKYGSDGTIVCCRFCEILRSGDADFLYEDDEIAVFRPLCPVVKSHVLVVPRHHIRNVNKLTAAHSKLLQRMKVVAEMVLGSHHGSLATSPTGSTPIILEASASTTSTSDADSHDLKFAFHTPPFNSIDHVHMHAFRKNEGSFGCVGSIKYRTETWWCRSFDEVMARIPTPSYQTASSTVTTSSDSHHGSVSSDEGDNNTATRAARRLSA